MKRMFPDSLLKFLGFKRNTKNRYLGFPGFWTNSDHYSYSNQMHNL